jgi:glycosyltransferase involved in cell wall biosynthesis
MNHAQSKPDVTTVILTFNEELHIARAIASAQVFSREILVVDSFSTDRTVEIAQSLGARVIKNVFVNQARQFNYALDHGQIKSEWILRLDADEVIGSELAVRFCAELPFVSEDVAGVILRRRHIFMGKWIRYGGRYPLDLLRLWRVGKARVEDRWMDEHVVLSEGKSIVMEGEFADVNERDIAFFVTKHNNYATREAIELLAKKYSLFPISHDSGARLSKQAMMKRKAKESFYNKLPFGFGPLAYFLFRYIIQLGFLDGRRGFIYHFMQGFWYRLLVDVRLLELEAALREVQDPRERAAAIRRLTGLKI